MKIGQLSKKMDIPMDTIRYYISRGLLCPKQKNGQYVFQSEDEADLNYIISLKKMKFSIKEIETMIRIRRTSMGIEPSAVEQWRTILSEKKRRLLAEKSEIQNAIEMVSEKLQYLNQLSVSSVPETTGVPLNAVEYLACPHCGAGFSLDAVKIFGKYIVSGHLTCDTCGYHAEIENGIIKTGNRYTLPYDSPNVDRGLNKSISGQMLRTYQRDRNYIYQSLQTMSLNGKAVMEGTINGHFFLYNFFAHLPKNCLYILTDKYIETLSMYKRLIEQQNLGMNILYIADSESDIPVRRNCIDVVIDFFSNNEWQLYHENTLVKDYFQYLREDCTVIGAYMDLTHCPRSRQNVRQKYPQSSSQCHRFDTYKTNLEQHGFTVTVGESDTVRHTEKIYAYACHEDNEPINFIRYCAQKL